VIACRFALATAALTLASCATPPPPPPQVAAPDPATPAPPPPPVKPSSDPSIVMLGGGCEAAKEVYVKRCMTAPAECVDKGSNEGVTGAYGAVLNAGAYLDACNSPLRVGVKVCVAVKDGHAVGVTVSTSPGDDLLTNCIAQKVQALPFPVYARLDVASTTFAAQ
jgi:eukaryotic-like serine/threonine-protein kinase